MCALQKCIPASFSILTTNLTVDIGSTSLQRVIEPSKINSVVVLLWKKKTSIEYCISKGYFLTIEYRGLNVFWRILTGAHCSQWSIDWAFIVNYGQLRFVIFGFLCKILDFKTFIFAQKYQNRPWMVQN